MIFPTVHLNGTHIDDLIFQTEIARHALLDAQDKLQAMMPNGRDYYPQGAEVIAKAISEHAERVKQVITLQNELSELLAYLYDQRELREKVKARR